jgi:hypothetical protein
MRRFPILGALLLAAFLFTLLFTPLSAQVRQPFEWIYAKRLTVDTNAAVGGNLTVAGGTNLVGNVTTDGTFSADGTITTQGGLMLIPGTAISVTDGSTITPTTAIQELTAAGNVGAGLAACGDGQVLTLVNLSNVTITITDTGSIRLAGNAALGQWDSLTVVGSGVTCVEVARANN